MALPQVYSTATPTLDVHNTTLTANGTGFPDSLGAFSLSFWIDFTEFFPFGTGGIEVFTADGSQQVIGATLESNGAYGVFIWQDGSHQASITGSATVVAPGTNNMLVSYDGDETITVTINNVNYGIAGLGGALVVATPRAWHAQGTTCVVKLADVWADPSFLDFTNPTNCQKFIEVDGATPVDLGSNGQNPLSRDPAIFLSANGSTPPAFATNLGSGGGAWAATDTLILACGGGATTCTVGDLWMASTVGPVDLSVVANRRLFVGEDGSSAFLGNSGELPTGAVPAVFLTNGATPANWPLNAGNGGDFALSSGSLAAAGTAPPPGAYEGALFNPPNTPQGADPQVRLSVSDDGGRTFSLLQKWRSMGKIGEYTKRLRWLKMGQFRQRMIRLEITDPVRRNIVGVYLDVTEGME